MAPSKCCECGATSDTAGPVLDDNVAAEAGDFCLCIKCGSLNIFFTENLGLRAPNDEELFAAARDPDIQRARRAIVEVNLKRSGGRS